MTIDQVASVGYVLFVLLIVILCLRAGDRMFRILKDELPRAVWEDVGAPSSLGDVFLRPDPRWRAMIRDRSYMEHCSPVAEKSLHRELRFIRRSFLVALIAGFAYLLLVLA